jgi:uncharacterized protein YjbI with pentapeptide repeats
MPVINGYTLEPQTSLRGALLAGLDLSGLHLEECDFTEADLRGTNLTCAYLDRAIFVRARAMGALLGCDEPRTTGCDWTDANLAGATLPWLGESVSASGVLAPGARSIPASRTRYVLQDDTVREYWKFTGVNWRGAKMKQADFRVFDFTGATLKGGRFNRSSFRGARLVGADLRGCELQRCDFRSADLTGARLERANLRGCDFRSAILVGTILEGTQITAEPFDS